MIQKNIYFDDIRVGDVSTGHMIDVTEDAIISFGQNYDPQPLHVDPAAAAQSRFGSLIASGWHTAAVVMRDLVDYSPFGSTPMLGLGIDALRWLHPVKPGDRLLARREVIALKPSSQKPQGIVSMRFDVTNQQAVLVMTFVALIQLPCG